jgi:hypothetical protein
LVYDSFRFYTGRTHVSGLAVRLEELAEIKLGCLDDLGFSDVDVLKREDTLKKSGNDLTSVFPFVDSGLSIPVSSHLGSLLNLPTDTLWYKLLYQLLQLAFRFPLHDLEHLLPDLPDLGRLCVRGLLDLLSVLSGEGDGEKSNEVTVGSSDVDVSLDQGLPFADERSELVGGEVHTVESGEAVLALRKEKNEKGKKNKESVPLRLVCNIISTTPSNPP